ncbi:MAG TPA: EAL domain-containing protein [Acidimicrobiales bacterium]|nr:EAL domain-containing protein [Acidimicrobiales bacterium]
MLVVDDAAPDRALITALLARSSDVRATVSACASLAEARAMIPEVQPDCVLLDLHLPDADGAELVREVVRLAPGAAVVVLTGWQDSDAAGDALAAGAQDHLLKQEITPEVLGRAVRYAIDRTRIRRDIQAGARRRQVVFDSVREGLVLYDLDGRVAEVNRAACELLERDADELLGGPFVTQLYPTFDATGRPLEPHTGAAGDTMRTGLPARGLIGMQLPAAGLRWLEVSSQPVTIDGELTGVVSTIVDVTDTRSARQELERARDRFAALIRSSADPMLVYDAEGVLAFASPALSRLVEVPDEVWVGRKVEDLLHPADRATFRSLLVSQVDIAGSTTKLECRFAVRGGGGYRHVELTQTNLLADPSVAGFVGNARDVTERVVIADRLAHEALHDVLTGLPNRALLLDRLGHALRRSERRRSVAAVLYLDLDGFKHVNDSLGHAAGDELLVAVARRLEALVRPSDTVARLGGDEFVIVMEDAGDLASVASVAERVRGELCRPVQVGTQFVAVGASIGVAIAHGRDPDALLQEADTALYRAKRAGRDRFEVYDATMQTAARDRLESEARLRAAIDRGRVRAVFQPLVRATTGEPVGAEALARLDEGNGVLVEPSAFIAVAEETGLVIPLGAAMLEAGCAEAAQREAPQWISVNVSSRQLVGDGFVASVDEALRRHGVAPERLCLELTEHTLVAVDAVTQHSLQGLRELGVRLAIDDFGAGWSGLSYLRRFPVDLVKIDRVFIAGLGREREDAEVVRAVVGLGHALSLEVVAEGIEEEAQAVMAAELGCDYAQGYYYGRPAARPV